MNELDALFLVMIVSFILAVGQINTHIQRVHASLLERCDEMENSIKKSMEDREWLLDHRNRN